MALLRHLRTREGRARWSLAALSLAFLAGCVLLGRMGEPELPFGFPHKVHAAEGLECLDCHAKVEEQEAPGYPSSRQCMLCHEELDEEKPLERRVESLFDGRVYRATHRSSLPSETVFWHLDHVQAGVDCASCHVGIEENEHVLTLPAFTMDGCMDCHARSGAPNECATCHSEISEGWAPASHQAEWKRRHGQVFRAGSEALVDRCTLCHQESSCAQCHMNELPQSHTNFFRLRGHGAAASMDRQSCATCHREDSCQACHSEVLPLSHRGSFGGTRSDHCFSCHFPLQSNNCITCHKGTPSHLLATPLPNDPSHSPGLNCRQCHGVSVSLPHADKGDECIACHR